MQLSIVIPLFNEQESLLELNKTILEIVLSMKIEFEIIYVDDGSTDNSWDIIKNLSKNSSNLIGIKFLRNFGKSLSSFYDFKCFSMLNNI